jgi:hypothetical protein
MALDGSLPGTGDGTLLPQRSLDGSFIDGGLQERRDACGTNHFGVSRLPSVPGPSSSPALYGHGGFMLQATLGLLWQINHGLLDFRPPMR